MVKSIILCALFIGTSIFAQEKQPETLRAMTFNIRMDTPNDGINQWSNRKEWVSEIVFFNDIDIIGMQEVLHNQLEDLETLLPHYDYVGEGREGGTKGEYSPIFYLKDRFKVLDSGTFWLSETPHEKGLKSWDSSLPRIATWARFEDKKSGKVFIHLNTHFDHRGPEARKNSVEVINQELAKITKGETIVFTGDFNLPPTDLPYQKIVESKYVDTRDAAMYRSELGYTHNAWKIEAPKSSRIDYIFLKGYDLAPIKYRELDIQRGPLFASDHYPVMTEFRWVEPTTKVFKKKVK